MRFPDLRDGYVEVVEYVRRHGRRREARGFVAYDVADAVFTVDDCSRVIPYGVGRNPKDEIGYAEAVLLCAGVESPSLLSAVSNTFRRFMDGGALAGSYGPLVRPQMEHVVQVLRDDPDSRQAVVQVHPGLQNVRGLRDVPCTINLGFELRSDGLHIRSTMRSNDVWLGLCYDAFQFCQLGWTVANVLGVGLQSYTHHAYSLHLYERNVGQSEQLQSFDGGTYDEPTGFGRLTTYALSDYETARARAESVYRGETPIDASLSEMMYLEKLSPYDRHGAIENFTS